MIKRIIRIVILTLFPFLLFVSGSLILMPGLSSDQSRFNLEFLKDGENRMQEGGNFRRRIWLDSEAWNFQSELDRKSIPIFVPSCWNSLPGLENFEGKAIYKLDFQLPKAGQPRTFLCFRGVSYQARVELNSKSLGEHQGAYTPFEFEVTDAVARLDQSWSDQELEQRVFTPEAGPSKSQLNRLQVEVNNELTMQSVPGKYEGWKNIGGIYREVYLEERSEVFLKEVRIIAEPSATGGKLKLEATVDNGLGKSGEFLVWAGLEKKWQRSGFEETVLLSGEQEKRVSLEREIAGVKPWSPGMPRLYPVTVRLYQMSAEGSRLLDQLSYQVGFRKIEARGSQLYLNGKPLKIKGISRHNFYPSYFQTIPPELVAADLQKIKDLGANLVRLGHYPNHPYVLELCDRLGLLAWEEIPTWGKLSPDYSDPAVIAAAKSQLSEMISRDRNHASLVIVGVANEIPSQAASGENFIKAMARHARPLLAGQLLAAASDQFEKDRGAPYLDLIGFNCYFGWYGGKIGELADTIGRIKTAIPNKPILISEYGADAQARRHGARGDIYTEENQALLLKDSYKIIEKDPALAGGIIWLFADYPDPIRVFNPKPFTNQKGLLTEDRKEKLGFQMASSLYQDEKLSFRARNRLPPRIRDGALASLIAFALFLGLFSRIPEKWILIMPGLTQPQKLLRRALFVIGLQTLIYETIWQSFLAHQPLALPVTFSFPSMKLVQLAFNSHLRPVFIFLFLFWLWWLMGEFLSLLLEKRKDAINRHPFELALGLGDPLSWAMPYPFIAIFPALIAMAINLPSCLIYREFLNNFATIPWYFFQAGYLLLILVTLIKLPLILRAGFNISFFRALLFLALFFIFANLLLALQLFFLFII